MADKLLYHHLAPKPIIALSNDHAFKNIYYYSHHSVVYNFPKVTQGIFHCTGVHVQYRTEET